MSEEEFRFELVHKGSELGLRLSPDDYTDSEVPAAITRFTGDFQLLQRLFAPTAL